jgi:hypothetical protein
MTNRERGMPEPDERILSSGCTPRARRRWEERTGRVPVIPWQVDGRRRPGVASELFAIVSMFGCAFAVHLGAVKALRAPLARFGV